MNVKYKYKQYLKALTDNLHNTTTTDVELNELGSRIFTDSKFMGVYAIDTLRVYKNKCSLIFNLDPIKKPGSHWCAIYFENGTAYVYDSFARNILLPKYDIKNNIKNKYKKYNIILTNKKKDQKATEYNCGQRCIAWLCMVHFHGIKNALNV